MAPGGCAHTNDEELTHWYSLELDAPQTVTRVQIARRTDAQPENDNQGRNVKITIGPSREYDADEPLCRPEITNLGYPAGLIDYECIGGPKRGKYVKLSSSGAGAFLICEVKVFIRA